MTMTPAAMAAAAPAHFFRLESIDFVTRGDSGMGILLLRERPARGERLRHQGCCLRRRRERQATCRKAKGEFQKVPAFHVISSSAIGSAKDEIFGAPR
jgi:hypothetical protein